MLFGLLFEVLVRSGEHSCEIDGRMLGVLFGNRECCFWVTVRGAFLRD